MIKSSSQIYCKTCHLVRKKCSNSCYRDICISCYRTQRLQLSKKKFLLDSSSVGGTVSTCLESIDLSTVKSLSSSDGSDCESNCSAESYTESSESVAVSNLEDDISFCGSVSSEEAPLDTDSENEGDEVYSSSGVEQQVVERNMTEKNTQEYGSTEDVSEDSASSKSACESTEERAFCINCKREQLTPLQMGDDVVEYIVLVERFRKDDVNWRVKKGKLIFKSDCSDIVSLCRECSNLLVNGKVKDEERKQWINTWPAYIWEMVSLGVNVGVKNILKYIPCNWIKYWAYNLVAKLKLDPRDVLLFAQPKDYETLYSILLISKAEYDGSLTGNSVTVDVTTSHRKFVKITKELKLGELKRGCDKYLMPRILCPWGCCTYLHKVGYLSCDAVYRKFLLNVNIVGAFSTTTEKKNAESMREDFFSTVIDTHLHNPDWTIHPSIVYKKGFGPLFVTCMDHNEGTQLKYFHLPRTGSCLPSLSAESLSHAVLNARTLKHSVNRLYSNSYQLQKCTGTYCGIDTCYVSDSRYFDSTSYLKDRGECMSYFGREDIRGLVNRLASKGVINEDMAIDIKERSEAMYNNELFTSEYVSGGTMMTLIDCLSLQKMLSEPQLINLVEDGKVISIRRLWSPALIRIHPNTAFGVQPNNVGSCQEGSIDLRLMWSVFLMICNISDLWVLADAKTSDKRRWEGHFLAYAAKKIIGQGVPKAEEDNPYAVLKDTKKSSKACGKRKGKSFSVNKNSLNKLLPHGDDVFDPVHLRAVFEAYSEIFCCSIPVRLTGQQLQHIGVPSNTEIIILYRTVPFVAGTIREIDHSFINGRKYELRMVLLSSSHNKKSRTRQESTSHIYETWEGECHYRHGTQAFPGWWKLQRGWNCVQENDLNVTNWNDVYCFVYVVSGAIQLDELRQEYLKYIGGQTKAYCKTHDVPFIVTASSKGPDLRHCKFQNACAKLEKYYCPIVNCSARICHYCFTSLENRTEIEAVVDVENEGPTQILFDSNSSMNDHTAEKDIEDTSETSSLCSSESSLNYDGLHTGDGVPIEDVEDCASVKDEDSYNHEALIPTTNAASKPMEYDGSFGYLGASVLLNKCGTLLVRRHGQLQASRRERNILERVVSVDDSATIPLVYLEGMLFPSLFWSLPHSSCGGILGSIPTALFCRDSTRKLLKVATIADHMKVRLKCASNPICSDPRYLSFAFDCLANSALAGQDTRVVLSRGFEESMGPAGLRLRNEEDEFYTDTIDNRQNVHNLAASEKECPSDLFVTFTCNQAEHFGVKNVKNYSTSEEAIQNVVTYIQNQFPSHPGLSSHCLLEIKKSIQEAARNLIVRNWFEVRLLLIDYISHSSEKPLGTVKKIFVRDEYQNDVGNLSHLHALVAVEDSYNTEKGRNHIQHLVRAAIDEIVGVDEVEDLIRDGILEDWEDYEHMKDQARKFLPHTCSPRCMRRTGPNENDVRCKVPDPLKLSLDTFEFFEFRIDVPHDEQTLRILERLGLCEIRSNSDGLFVPTSDFLKAKRILPPIRFGEGNISPVVGRLFAATRSAMNIQICTSFGTSRYIVKYLIKIDENNYVVFSKKKDNPEGASAERIHLNNTKITSSAINEQKKLKLSRHKNKPKGRQIAATEQMQLILGYPQIHTNIDFVRVSTLPLAERAGFERMAPIDSIDEDNDNIKCEQDAFDFSVPCVKARQDAFSSRQRWRCHTSSQIIMLRDQMHCPVSLDRVFIFGIRPPELLLIDKLEWYFRFFKRGACRIVKKEGDADVFLDYNLDLSKWIDGLGFSVRLRSKAAAELYDVLTNPAFLATTQGTEKEKMRQYLLDLCTLTLSAEKNELLRGPHLRWTRLKKNYMVVENRLPIPVFSNVKPLNAARFIIHILLSLGHFETESDIWSSQSISEAFVKTRLILRKSAEEIDKLLLMWIETQLRFYPIGSKKMDEFIVAANAILYSAIIDDELVMSEIPPYLYTTLTNEVSEEIHKYLLEVRTEMAHVTVETVMSIYESTATHFPTKNALIAATKSNPVHWTGEFPKTPQQSLPSYTEQRTIQRNIRKAVNQYISSQQKTAKNFIVCGPPGSGKTHCMSQGIMYCMSQGLYCVTTAILADRARVLGGIHVHKLFGLKVRDTGTPHRLAELAIIALQKRPEHIALLRKLDVVFFDELGQLSAEQVAVLDIVLRRIRDSNIFLGGILLIGTIDQHQLRPIKGLPFLLSPFIMTCFWMGKLQHYVRCAQCSDLQEMNAIARSYVSDEEEWSRLLTRFEFLLRTKCTFVDEWSHKIISDDVIRVFPRRHQTAAATDLFVQQKMNSLGSTCSVLKVHAKDSMNAFESHGDWKAANDTCKKFLNRKCNEPQTLYLYSGAVYQFTFNKPGHFNTTQLGVLIDIPSKETLMNFKDFEIFVAPAGCKCMGISHISTDELISNGWKRRKISIAPQYSRTIWNKGIKVKRKQYGMKLHVSSTIHSAIGSTLGKVATSLTSDGFLWERAMVVVLISRVSFAKDLIFVGDKRDNIRALLYGLRVRDQFAEYMNHIVDVLVTSTDRSLASIALNLCNHPFRPKDIQLPHRNEGVVYMLISVRDRRSLYIGQTMSLEKRIKSHNAGYGASESADPTKRPWGLFAYVTGFLQDRDSMLSFEKRWQNHIHTFKPNSPYEAVQLGSKVLQDNFGDYGLRIITCKE